MAKKIPKSDDNGDTDEVLVEPIEPIESASAEMTAEAVPALVGSTLKKHREERGEDLRYVAQILRIRFPYLQAIEDSQIDELPGPTYAIGFVRTYAEHLGLESRVLVNQFKAEIKGLNARSDLHFPAPIPEGGIPSGAVLAVAVVMAGVIFGVWSYLSSPDDPVPENVPEMPAGIGGTVERSSDSASRVLTVPSEEAAGRPESRGAPVLRASSDAAATNSPQKKTAESAKPVVTSKPVVKAEKTIVAAPIAGAVVATRKAIPEVPAVPSARPAENDGATPSALASRTPRTAPAAVDPSRTEPGRAPIVYGSENGEGRIVVEAVADSWVEVRDSATDERLLTRVLFKGDRYLVPNRPGLSLHTGNAGGLRIVVDGVDAPAIGPVGSVRRDVLLEPDKLKRGARSSGGATRSETSDQ